MGNTSHTVVARIDYTLRDIHAGEQDFHKIHEALFFHLSSDKARWHLYQNVKA